MDHSIVEEQRAVKNRRRTLRGRRPGFSRPRELLDEVSLAPGLIADELWNSKNTTVRSTATGGAPVTQVLYAPASPARAAAVDASLLR